MTRFFQHKANKKQYKLNGIVDKNAFLNDIQSGDDKTVTLSTLHRYYEEVQPPKKEQPKKQPVVKKQPVTKEDKPKSYYRHYERNEKPLWNTTVEENILYVNDEKGNKVIKCNLSKTGNCIRIEQLKLRARRYFTNFARAKRHIVYDQDIKTTQYVGDKFDKWLKDAQKALASK